MSARKRRVKRQIARLLRMDAQHWRKYGGLHECDSGIHPSQQLFVAMRALGTKIARSKHRERSIAALKIERDLRGQAL
jgi:hypothetical protein